MAEHWPRWVAPYRGAVLAPAVVPPSLCFSIFNGGSKSFVCTLHTTTTAIHVLGMARHSGATAQVSSLPRPSWSLPSFSIDFNVNLLDFPCLTYDHTAKAVQSHCFDFPSLSISIPFISNPFQFVCNEGCDSSCDSGCDDSCDDSCDSRCDGSCDSSCNGSCDDSCNDSCDRLGRWSCDHGCDSSCDTCYSGCDNYCDSWCDTSCNTSCDSSCNDSCESSCNFLATCGSSGRRLEDSLELITSEPKAIGWSERLAAAAANESN